MMFLEGGGRLKPAPTCVLKCEGIWAGLRQPMHDHGNYGVFLVTCQAGLIVHGRTWVCQYCLNKINLKKILVFHQKFDKIVGNVGWWIASVCCKDGYFQRYFVDYLSFRMGA